MQLKGSSSHSPCQVPAGKAGILLGNRMTPSSCLSLFLTRAHHCAGIPRSLDGKLSLGCSRGSDRLILEGSEVLSHIVSQLAGNLAGKAELGIRKVLITPSSSWRSGDHRGPSPGPRTHKITIYSASTIPLNKAQLELTWPSVMCLSPVPSLFRLLKLATARFTT